MNLMRDLGQMYVRYFNKRRQRSGTLWQGRFHSSVVESARYVLACYRYIELNPVRARMVDDPRSYSWSSHQANRGLAVDPLIVPHAEYVALAGDPTERSRAYTRIFDDCMDEALIGAIRDAVQGNLPLGSDSFKTKLAADGRKVDRARPGPLSVAGASNDKRQLKIVL